MKELKNDEFIRLLDRLVDKRFKKILNLPYFLIAYNRHLKHEENFDIEKITSKYEDPLIDKNEVESLCIICDFINRNNEYYVPIIKSKKLITYNFTSQFEDGLVHHLTIGSDTIDICGVFECLSKFLDYIIFDSNKIRVVSIQNLKDCLIDIKDPSKFIVFDQQQLVFYGEEGELTSIVEIFEKAMTIFVDLVDRFNIMEYINKLLTFVPLEVKSARIRNFTTNDRLIVYFEKNKIKDLGELNEINWIKTNLNTLSEIANIFETNDFESPRLLFENLLKSLKSREVDILRLKYKDGMKFTEMGQVFGITRSATQFTFTKARSEMLSSVDSRKILNRLIDQILLFRDNDFFIKSETIEKLGLWKGFVEDLLWMPEYKNSGLLVLEQSLNRRYDEQEIEKYQFRNLEKNYNEITSTSIKDFEFEIIKILPNIIKKSELDGYINHVIDNCIGYISKEDYKLLISINFVNYNTVISKSKLNLSYFIKEILKTYFPEGLKVNDEKNIKAIKNLLKELFNFEVTGNDRYLISKICQLSSLVDKGLWKLNEGNIVLPLNITNRISSYIKNYNISAIPIRILYEQFAEDLIDFGIDNKYFFQGYLKENFGCEYKITKDYVYTDESQTYVEIITEFIKNSKQLVTKDLLEKKFPGIQIGIIQRVINTSSIVNMNGYYASLDNFNLSEKEIYELRYELGLIIQDEKPHNSKKIFLKFRTKFNGLFNRIGLDHYLQLYYILNKLFDDDFEFLRPFIAKKGVDIPDKENQVVDLIVQAGGVDHYELRKICDMTNYFLESIVDLVIRNNDRISFRDYDNIVPIEKLEINEEKCAKIDTILDKFMLTYDYRNLSELETKDEICKISEDINKWMLYSLISTYSIKYKVFKTSNSMLKTELLLAKEDFDIKKFKDDIYRKSTEIYNMYDLLEIDDLE